MSKPTIFAQTSRLWLRPFSQSDLYPFTTMRSDPTIARYQSWSEFTTADGYLFILEMQDARPGTPGQWYQFAVALRDSNQFIGDCALFTNENGRFGEIGFTFAPAYQGKGYATEAVTAVLQFAFNKHHFQQIKAIVDSRNTASIKLLTRLHFQIQKQETAWFKNEQVQENYYMLTQETWQQHQNTTENP